MLSLNDFSKKQLVFVFACDGEKISFANENLVVKIESDDKDGKKHADIKFQVSLYKLFIVYVVGDLSITTVIIKKAQKYGFFIALMSTGFKLYDIIGAKKDGNTLLHEKQYKYNSIDIAKLLVKNKIVNQKDMLSAIRNKTDDLRDVICVLDNSINKIDNCLNIHDLLSIEGNCAKIYFREMFFDLPWYGRKPRIKSDIINAILDIGYTLLFSIVDTIISCYGFDTYKGVYHTQFYMRKSLVCDIVEPFRCLIDKQVKKSYNLNQINKNDFVFINNQYKLKWENSKKYVNFLMQPLINEKDEIFRYIQSYYRAFMKEKEIKEYPIYRI